MWTENWFVGSNGNLFRDSQKYRYSIGLDRWVSVHPKTYWVARNGEPLASEIGSLEAAKRFADTDMRKVG